jgi:hypothetical protein
MDTVPFGIGKEVAEDSQVLVGLLDERHVGAVVEDDPFGSRQAVHHRGNEARCHLVVATGCDKHRHVDFGEPVGDVPVLDVAGDVPLGSLHDRVDVLVARVTDAMSKSGISLRISQRVA